MLPETIVRVQNVTKNYSLGGEDICVLKDVSFNIRAGEFVAIVGASGNGKSTLLNMITGIDHPTSGQVIVNGQAVHDLNEDDLSSWRGKNLGIVFQFFQLLPALSLLQNVILPMEFAGKLKGRMRRDRALELLDLVGLADQAHKLPGLVSGGQQQRAAIARALANDPPLLLADEPTGNLDAKTSDDVFRIFDTLVSQGKTLVMVTHDGDLASRAGRIVEVVNGQAIFRPGGQAPPVNGKQHNSITNLHAALQQG